MYSEAYLYKLTTKNRNSQANKTIIEYLVHAIFARTQCPFLIFSNNNTTIGNFTYALICLFNQGYKDWRIEY